MTIKVNGKQVEVEEQTIAQYVGNICKQTKGVAICLNLEVISKDDWANIKLKEGDRLDIVQTVGGG